MDPKPILIYSYILKSNLENRISDHQLIYNFDPHAISIDPSTKSEVPSQRILNGLFLGRIFPYFEAGKENREDQILEILPDFLEFHFQDFINRGGTPNRFLLHTKAIVQSYWARMNKPRRAIEYYVYSWVDEKRNELRNNLLVKENQSQFEVHKESKSIGKEKEDIRIKCKADKETIQAYFSQLFKTKWKGQIIMSEKDVNHFLHANFQGFYPQKEIKKFCLSIAQNQLRYFMHQFYYKYAESAHDAKRYVKLLHENFELFDNTTESTTSKSFKKRPSTPIFKSP